MLLLLLKYICEMLEHQPNLSKLTDQDLLADTEKKYIFHLEQSKIYHALMNLIQKKMSLEGTATLEKVDFNKDDMKLYLEEKKSSEGDGEDAKIEKTEPDDFIERVIQKLNSNPKGKRTFEEIVLSMLDDDMPKTPRMLYEMFTIITASDLSHSDFTTRLSILAKRSNNLSKQRLEMYDSPYRFWWVKRDWCATDGILKESYRLKVHEFMNK